MQKFFMPYFYNISDIFEVYLLLVYYNPKPRFSWLEKGLIKLVSI